MYVQKALFGSSAFKGVRNHFWIVICELPDRFCVLKVLNFGFRAVFLYKKRLLLLTVILKFGMGRLISAVIPFFVMILQDFSDNRGNSKCACTKKTCGRHSEVAHKTCNPKHNNAYSCNKHANIPNFFKFCHNIYGLILREMSCNISRSLLLMNKKNQVTEIMQKTS